MTSAIARGFVPFDVTGIVPRSFEGHCDWPLSVRPPRRILQHLGRDVDLGVTVTDNGFGSALEAEPKATTQYRTRGPDKLQRKYTISHLVNALRVSINFTNESGTPENVHLHVFGICTPVISNVLAEKSGHRDPAEDTLVRARVKFDVAVAAMIRHRRWSEAAGQINRYGWFPKFHRGFLGRESGKMKF